MGVSPDTAQRAVQSATVRNQTVAPTPFPAVLPKTEGRDGKLRPATRPEPEALEERAERVAEAKAEGKTVDQIAQDEQVSPRTVNSRFRPPSEVIKRPITSPPYLSRAMCQRRTALAGSSPAPLGFGRQVLAQPARHAHDHRSGA